MLPTLCKGREQWIRFPAWLSGARDRSRRRSGSGRRSRCGRRSASRGARPRLRPGRRRRQREADVRRSTTGSRRTGPCRRSARRGCRRSRWALPGSPVGARPVRARALGRERPAPALRVRPASRMESPGQEQRGERSAGRGSAGFRPPGMGTGPFRSQGRIQALARACPSSLRVGRAALRRSLPGLRARGPEFGFLRRFGFDRRSFFGPSLSTGAPGSSSKDDSSPPGSSSGPSSSPAERREAPSLPLRCRPRRRTRRPARRCRGRGRALRVAARARLPSPGRERARERDTDVRNS